MGYTLTIGEAILRNYGDSLAVEARGERRDDAPAFGEPTDYTNSREPSYSAWAASMRFVGLYDLMNDKEDGLLRCHPGFQLLTIDHKIQIDAAFDRFNDNYPNTVPGFMSDEELESSGASKFGNDPITPAAAFARLLWLKYWVNWALEKCENPIIENT